MSKFKIILFLVFMGIGFANSYAEDSDTIKIILKPIIKDLPTAPRSPSFLKLSACLVEDEVVVTSNVDVMAEVKIYDAEINQTYYNATVALAPDCHCPLPQVDTELTLQVIIDDRTYQGTFKR